MRKNRDANNDTPSMARFRKFVTTNAVTGKSPTLDTVVEAMGWKEGSHLPGWAVRIRREVLESLGWVKWGTYWTEGKNVRTITFKRSNYLDA